MTSALRASKEWQLSVSFYPNGVRETIYIVISFCVAACGLYMDHFEYFQDYSCFQRSGSILVVLGAVSESKHVEKVIAEDKGIIGAPLSLKQNFIIHSGFFVAIAGTLIWGFGDIYP